MAAVTFIFAINLFGLFEMLLPSSISGRMATAGATAWWAASRRDFRHAAGDAVLRAVPRHRRGVRAGSTAAGSVAGVHAAGIGDGATVAVCRTGAENRAAAAASRPVDEKPQNSARADDVGLKPMALLAAGRAFGKPYQRHDYLHSDGSSAYGLHLQRKAHRAALLAGGDCAGRLWWLSATRAVAGRCWHFRRCVRRTNCLAAAR